MNDLDRAEEVLEQLAGGGGDAEVYLKEGRGRRFSLSPEGELCHFVQEQGWAVRAGDGRCSFFVAASGPPRPRGPWPEPDGYPLRLPDAVEPAPWREPAEVESPLLGEREGVALLAAIAEALARELPGARLQGALLEDGSSVSTLASTQGVRARWRQRLAALRLLARRGDSPVEVSLERAEREARRFHPGALASALADRLAAVDAGAPPPRDRGDMVLAPPVVARLLAHLAPLWLGPEAAERAAALGERTRLAAAAVTLVDDGRLPEGLLSAPVDGEGVPTREVVLIEAGGFRQPLVAWWQRGAWQSSGCAARPSWRDLPLPGPTHLYLRPDPAVRAGALLAAISRGYYLLDTRGPGWCDLRTGRFALPVCGFAIRDGRAQAPLGAAWLVGGVAALLRGIQAVARDLAFSSLGGMIGAPTVVATGLEVRRAPG